MNGGEKINLGGLRGSKTICGFCAASPSTIGNHFQNFFFSSFSVFLILFLNFKQKINETEKNFVENQVDLSKSNKNE